MDIILSFLLGFLVSWIFSTKYQNELSGCNLKDCMIEIIHKYDHSKKVCDEVKNYSMEQIFNGNHEYVEVIDTIKRNSNDKT
jgi:hypothetical protein